MDALKAAMTGKNETITYTGNITKADGFEIDFSEVVRNTPVYAEGNTAELTLKFPNIKENAVLTFKGGVNAPKVLRITTGTKCSLRINLASSDVHFDGMNYKYIVLNSGVKYYNPGTQYEAMFVAGSEQFYPADYTNSHQIGLDTDFTLKEPVVCKFAKKHENQSCTFINEIQTWINNNSFKTLWDFVGESNN